MVLIDGIAVPGRRSRSTKPKQRWCRVIKPVHRGRRWEVQVLAWHSFCLISSLVSISFSQVCGILSHIGTALSQNGLLLLLHLLQFNGRQIAIRAAAEHAPPVPTSLQGSAVCGREPGADRPLPRGPRHTVRCQCFRGRSHAWAGRPGSRGQWRCECGDDGRPGCLWDRSRPSRVWGRSTSTQAWVASGVDRSWSSRLR